MRQLCRGASVAVGTALRNGLGATRMVRETGVVRSRAAQMVFFEGVFFQGQPDTCPPPGRCPKEVRDAWAKDFGLGVLYLHTSVGGPCRGVLVAAVAQIRSRSSGRSGLRVAVVEPSAKTF